MTGATYFRNNQRSFGQHRHETWVVLTSGAAAMFAMATLAMLWV